jgi:hypothetical protein
VHTEIRISATEQTAQSAVAVKNAYIEKLSRIEEDNTVFKAELGEQVSCGCLSGCEIARRDNEEHQIPNSMIAMGSAARV